ncbi:phage tail protein [Xanthobacter flavus]|uniref:phage tail protein n=1 Tax=Xanthobacter flavus TaxID=281 RepID=UPI00372BCA70
MTQFNMSPINPATTSGPDLANYLEGVRDAAYSSHLGNSRPAYVRDGMLWIKSVSATAWEVYLANGSNDALIGSLNPVTNTFAAAKVINVYTSAQVDALVGAINGNLAGLFADLTGKADAAALATATTPAGTIAPFAGVRVPTGWLRCDGASYLATAQPALFAALVVSSNVTITIGANATIGWANHGLGADYPVKFTTTGTLPTGITAGTTYYVLADSLATNSFRVSTTPGGAPITTSGSGGGTHKAICAPSGCINDLTSFNVPEGRGEFFRGHHGGRVSVDDLRVFGSWQADEFKSHTHAYSRVASGTGIQPAAALGWGLVSSETEARGGAETRPRNLSGHWIIKA